MAASQTLQLTVVVELPHERQVVPVLEEPWDDLRFEAINTLDHERVPRGAPAHNVSRRLLVHQSVRLVEKGEHRSLRPRLRRGLFGCCAFGALVAVHCTGAAPLSLPSAANPLPATFVSAGELARAAATADRFSLPPSG